MSDPAPEPYRLTPPVFDRRFQSDFESLIVWRRDVRRFRTDPIDAKQIERLIGLSCLAPSVGNSQPWRFVNVTSKDVRTQVRENFLVCNAEALNDYAGEQAKLYASLKLAGLDDAPVHLAVFCDSDPSAGHGLGRKTMPEMLAYSVVGAIHTLWLAARSVGIGVGWVSIIDPVKVQATLDVPDTWFLVAYLCVGRPQEELSVPELVQVGWQSREEVSKFLIER